MRAEASADSELLAILPADCPGCVKERTGCGGAHARGKRETPRGFDFKLKETKKGILLLPEGRKRQTTAKCHAGSSTVTDLSLEMIRFYLGATGTPRRTHVPLLLFFARLGVIALVLACILVLAVHGSLLIWF